MRAFIRAGLAPLIVLVVAACQTTINEPVENADTVMQTAYATYGTFVVVQETAADMVERPETEGPVRETVKEIDEVAHPIAVSLVDAAKTAEQIRADFKNGEADADQLTAALSRVISLTQKLQPHIQELQEAIN